MKKLSIITPCFNSTRTLRETIDSCYKQGLSDEDFEIVLVDDGSTDGTKELISTIVTKHKNIRALFHEFNRGGGAARNTGIKAAKYEIIYCLDSDNFFAPNSVKPILEFFETSGADGVAYYERRFFTGSNAKQFSAQYVEVLDRPITIQDLFATPVVLLDNFFYTKSSYEKTDGYPEHHGFDSQSFELRYLSAGNIVRICPRSIFYHRQADIKESYFEREYNKGNFSINYYLCIEDVLALFSREAEDFIVNYDIFKKSTISDNLLRELQRLHREGKLFEPESASKRPLSPYALSVMAYKQGDYKGALLLIESCVTEPHTGTLYYYHALRTLVGLSGVTPPKIEKTTAMQIARMQVVPTVLFSKFRKNPIIKALYFLLRPWKAKFLDSKK